MRGLLIALLLLSATPAAGAQASTRGCGDLARKLHNHRVVVTAITADCATAKRVGRAWLGRGGCGECRVKGWRCRAVPDSGTTRCARPHRPRRVFELDVVIRGGDYDG